MGRTLHYKVTNAEALTEAEKELMVGISEKYNEGDFKDIWTCENFFLNPWDYYPNWQHKVFRTGNKQVWTASRGFEYPSLGVKESWELITKEIDKNTAKGMSRGKAIEAAAAKGYVAFHDKDEIRGFTKVGGNEFNALLVYIALIEITTRTSAIITLHDEGEFLLESVIIKEGRAQLDEEQLKEDMEWKQGKLDEGEKDYGYTEGIEKIKTLLKCYPSGDNWYDPLLFCRKVNPDDFKAHPEYGASQIMAGFYGEYFGLSDNDAEAESYKMIQMLCGTLEQHGVSKDQIKIGKSINEINNTPVVPDTVDELTGKKKTAKKGKK